MISIKTKEKTSSISRSNVDMTKKSTTHSNSVKFTFDLPVHIHQQFKVKAAMKRVKMAEVIMPAILAFIEQDK